MRSVKQFSVIDAHTAGAPVRVVVGGAGRIPGSSVAEKRDWLRENRDDIRTILMYEPRGHAGMSGSIVVEPCDPSADVGIVFMEVSGWLPMCGHGTIGTITALVEAGMVPVEEPETVLTVEVPAGLIRVRVEVVEGAARSVTIENVASYLAVSDLTVEVPGWGDVTLDIAYGGNFYAIVPAERFGIELVPEQADRVLEVTRAVRDAVCAVADPVHPESPWIHGVSHVMLTEPLREGEARARNTILFGEAGIGRDPCGTGTSARLAQLHARGVIPEGGSFVHEGLLGTEFIGRVISETTVGDRAAIRPTVTGSAYVTGLTTFLVDPGDPLPLGFGVGYGNDVSD